MLTEPQASDFEQFTAMTDGLVGLTAREDRVWCRNYAQRVFRNEGLICELGPWLGSLTVPLAMGLAQNPWVRERRKIIHCYDIFTWDPWCENLVKGTEHSEKLTLGQNYIEYFTGILGSRADYVQAYQADLNAAHWVGGAIALLLNDAVKSISTASNFILRFLPHVLEERGFVAHQDYMWSTESFLHIMMYLLRDHYEIDYMVPNSCMVVFRCLKSPVPLIRKAADIMPCMPRSVIQSAFDWSRSVLRNGYSALSIDLCESVCLWNAGYRHAAVRLFKRRGFHKGTTGDPFVDWQVQALKNDYTWHKLFQWAESPLSFFHF